MKIILQKVKSVKFIGSNLIIKEGFIVFLAISKKDTLETIEWMTDKILKLRLYDGWKTTISQKQFEIVIKPEQSLLLDFSHQQPQLLNHIKDEKVEFYCEKFYELLCQKHSNDFVKFISKDYVERLEIVNDGPFTIILNK